MLWLIIGGAVLFVFMGGLRAFEQASVTTVKSFFAWLSALGGIALVLMLILSGRGVIAILGLLLFGPLLWQTWKTIQAPAAEPPRIVPFPNRAMRRAQAYEVLGLAPGASELEIRAAHKRLMSAADPENGGSDWLAARINEARDVLLGSPNHS